MGILQRTGSTPTQCQLRGDQDIGGINIAIGVIPGSEVPVADVLQSDLQIQG
jgi:hypothetical protein